MEENNKNIEAKEKFNEYKEKSLNYLGELKQDITLLVKHWISKNPLTVFEQSISTRSAIGILVISTLISVITLLNGANTTLNGFPFISGGSVWKLFIPIMIYIFGLFIILASLIWLGCIITKPDKISFTESLKFVAINVVPTTCLTIIGFVVSFVSLELFSLITGLTGIVLIQGIILGVGKYFKNFQQPYYWVMTGIFVLFMVAFMMYSKIYLEGIFKSFIPSPRSELDIFKSLF